MGDFRHTATIFISTLGLTALGWSLAAQAQSSPFAKKGKQAWETATTTPAPQPQPYTQPQPYQYPVTTPTTSAYKPAGTLTPPTQTSTTSAPNTNYPSSYTYTLPKTGQAAASTYGGSPAPVTPTAGSPYPVTGTGTPSAYTGMTSQNTAPTAPSQSPFAAPTNGASYEYPTYNRNSASQPALRGPQTATGSSYYPGRENPQGTGQRHTQQAPSQYNQQQQGYKYPYGQNQTGTAAARPKPGLSDKLGLRNVAFSYDGYLKAGAAGTYRDFGVLGDDFGEDFILDGALRGEVSAITQGGLEYGVAAELRGQYDQYRRGFGGLVGDCPAGIAGCIDDGAGNVLRGHTSRFYASGENDAKDFEAQLESAHIFLRSAYGDLTIGRDDGSAYLFSLGAPTLLNVGASNNSVDYTGLDAVKTVNDASGFSEKVTYTSPRLLGDQIGAGIQFGVSYALDAKACGVDYCVRSNDKEPLGVIAPDLEDIVELGAAIDRKFANGLSVEATATYAMGSEQSGLDAFDDLKAMGLGLELGYMDWTLGGSYLDSNNGLANGDYTAMDVGLTWKPSKLGITVGYGHATDDNVGLTSNQAIAGVSYDWSERFRIGVGAQYVDRDVNIVTAGLVSAQNEKAASAFVEGRFTF